MPLRFQEVTSVEGWGTQYEIWETGALISTPATVGKIVIFWPGDPFDALLHPPQIKASPNAWGLFKRKPLQNALDLIAHSGSYIDRAIVRKYLLMAGCEEVVNE